MSVPRVASKGNRGGTVWAAAQSGGKALQLTVATTTAAAAAGAATATAATSTASTFDFRVIKQAEAEAEKGSSVAGQRGVNDALQQQQQLQTISKNYEKGRVCEAKHTQRLG